MSSDGSNSELRNTWEAAAPGWAKWERALSVGFESVTDNLLDMAGVGSGARVLDVACGAGSHTIQAARRVGPDGAVVASDISSAMLEQVRQNAEAAGLTNIEMVESAAESLAATEIPFDAAISRMGLMLFPGPSSAVVAIARALNPGARFAAMVFSTPANNPFAAQPMAILLRHANKQPPGSDQPGIFALGGEGVLETLLSEGGLDDIKTMIVRAPLNLPNAADALQMIQQAFGVYREVVADLSESKRADAWSEVLSCLGQFETSDGFTTELEFVIGSGMRT